MSSEIFSALEIDAIGEILNISLGASATAASNMLNRRVDITTPNVSVVTYDEFQFAEIEPAIGVEITYISGLSGRNVMLLKRHDAKVICEILMGMEIADDEFELNEMNMSAICEVMNQMMGGSSTALSEFLGEVVNISTPTCFEIPDLEAFKTEYFGEEREKAVAYFKLKIEDAVESQFMNLMPVPLAKKLLRAFNLGDDDIEEEYVPEVSSATEPVASESSGGGTLSQEEIEKLLGNTAPEPEVAMPETPGRSLSQEEIEKLMGNTSSEPEDSPEPSPASSGGKMSQEEIERLMGGMNAQAPSAGAQPGTTPPNMGQQQGMYGMPPMGMYPPGFVPQDSSQQNAGMPPMGMYPYMYPYGYPYGMYPPQQEEKKQKEPRDPRILDVKPITTPQFEENAEELGKEQAENLSLIMEVPLEVSVEIGRTKKCVKDILELTSGSLVVLDKLAGEQVDIYANGQCIAKGDVVVVDDSFGVRITEIVKNSDIKLVDGIGNE